MVLSRSHKNKSRRNNIRVLLFGLLFFLFFHRVPGQQESILDKQISISFKNQKLLEALSELQEMLGFVFSYAPSSLDGQKSITKDYENTSVRFILNDIVGLEGTAYAVRGQTIHIRIRSQNPNKKKPQATHSAISGTVVNAQGNGVPFATVVLKDTGQGILTDAFGVFQIDKTPLGAVTLSVSHQGYAPEEMMVATKAGETSRITIAMEESLNQLDEVVVTEKNQSKVIEQKGFNVKSIELKQFENTTRDINQIIGATAGVRIRETGGLGSNFNFFLNGLSGRQVKFFQDGQPLENFGELFNLNNIPANLIERVEIYKGVVPVHLGADALGGAVNLISKESAGNFLDISYSFGSFNTHRSNLIGQWRNKNSGFTIKPQFFWNYSDNNYTMNNLETPTGIDGQVTTGDFERFHDTFQSYLTGIEFGFTAVGWADQFMVGGSYGALDKDIQTASRGTRVSAPPFAFRLPAVGEAVQDEENARITLRYKKKDFIADKVDFNLYASYNDLKQTSIDTSSNAYNWRGQIVATGRSTGELGIPKTRFRFDQKAFVLNSGLVFQPSKNHTFNANFTWSDLDRQGRDTFLSGEENPFTRPNRLAKKILGISYELVSFKDRLSTTFLAKYFNLNILARQSRQFEFGSFDILDLRTEQERIGYGMAVNYALAKHWQIKASYEKTYRLPEPFEIFGDGLLILANPEILPESSDNVNANIIYRTPMDQKWDVQLGLNGFLRWTDDMIFPALGGQLISYENQRNVYIRGFELDLKASWKNRLQIGINGTYQDVINNQEFNAISGRPNPFFRERLFNTPFLFGNANVNYALDQKLFRKIGLNFFYDFNYVEEFFLNYPNVSRGGSKFTIPSQFLHHIGTTISSINGRYNLSLELRNLTNAQAFDDFALQKPGRAFFIKLRYFLNSNF